jgi:ABC-type multidrug transport system ATPase subunit
MQIEINHLGKKFGSEWIFRNLSFQIADRSKLVILGGNGSGKSTLLQMLSGFITPNEGKIEHFSSSNESSSVISQNKKKIEIEELRRHISLASPYLQLIEDFTLFEIIEHAGKFKPFINQFSTGEIIEILELTEAKNKFVKQFSSGMKQRLKLGLAILSNSSLVLLDEPVSNLDKSGVKWYKKIIEDFAPQRNVIVCSNNIDDEYFFCDTQLNVMDFKYKRS